MVSLISTKIELVKAKEWKIKKSTHFIIYYDQNIEKRYIDGVIKYAERYYNTIAQDLGFTWFDFWSWDNRAKIYIYKDRNEYLKETNQPQWSGGTVSVKEKAIFTFPWQKDFLNRLLPHELTHIIFREVIGHKVQIPLWFEEGIAVYEERVEKRYKELVKNFLEMSMIIPLHKLSVLKKRDLILSKLFYAESASVIEFLLTQFGKEKFYKFCKFLRDKKNFSKALREIYYFKNLEELNEAWLEYVKNGIK